MRDSSSTSFQPLPVVTSSALKRPDGESRAHLPPVFLAPKEVRENAGTNGGGRSAVDVPKKLIRVEQMGRLEHDFTPQQSVPANARWETDSGGPNCKQDFSASLEGESNAEEEEGDWISSTNELRDTPRGDSRISSEKTRELEEEEEEEVLQTRSRENKSSLTTEEDVSELGRKLRDLEIDPGEEHTGTMTSAYYERNHHGSFYTPHKEFALNRGKSGKFSRHFAGETSISTSSSGDSNSSSASSPYGSSQSGMMRPSNSMNVLHLNRDLAFASSDLMDKDSLRKAWEIPTTSKRAFR